MDTTWKVTEEDRDAAGSIKVDRIAPAEPRSLADLLPNPEAIQKGAARRSWTRADMAGLAAVVMIAAFVLVYGWQSPQALPTSPQPRAAPAATFQPTSAPTIAPALAGRLLIAFAAPNAEPLGAIESTRAIVPTAHYGDSWIQADVSGSGLVWLRAVDLPDVALIGPDLAPPTPRPAPAYVPVAAPPAAPAPTQCAEVRVAGKEARSCGTEDLSVLQERAKEMWVAAFGGNIGSGDMHPTPQPWEEQKEQP